MEGEGGGVPQSLEIITCHPHPAIVTLFFFVTTPWRRWGKGGGVEGGGRGEGGGWGVG